MNIAHSLTRCLRKFLSAAQTKTKKKTNGNEFTIQNRQIRKSKRKMKKEIHNDIGCFLEF